MGKKHKGYHHVTNHGQHNTAHKRENTNLHDPQRYHFFKPRPEKTITEDPCTNIALLATVVAASAR